ncbi:hypothetical protein L7F22_063401 [Adiantum nelumboides]|nr:hypothetical protein [Adiantum nelumboides]
MCAAEPKGGGRELPFSEEAQTSSPEGGGRVLPFCKKTKKIKEVVAQQASPQAAAPGTAAKVIGQQSQSAGGGSCVQQQRQPARPVAAMAAAEVGLKSVGGPGSSEAARAAPESKGCCAGPNNTGEGRAQSLLSQAGKAAAPV